jgi:hypothetical protein
MKACTWIVFLILLAAMPLMATDYYSRPSGYLNDTNTWRTNRDGSGSSPSNFLSSNQVFYVQNTHTKTANGTWYVSGTGSKVVIETGGQITSGSYDHNIDLDMQSGATYLMTHLSYFALNALSWDANSTFIVNRNTFKESISYGNLILRSANVGVTGSSGLTVRGILTIESGSSFVGGTNTNHTNTIPNIVMTGGEFYGSYGTGNVIYNISGSISLSGSSTFYGSESTGTATYNITGDVNVGSSATFYACYRSTSGDLPNTTYNIAGSFTCDGSNYYARNRSEGGTPTFYFSGSGKNLGFAPASSTASCQHNIYISSGGSCTLTRDLYGGQNAIIQISNNGTLYGGNYQIINYGGYNPNMYVYGRFYTERATGLVGNSTDAVSFSSPAYLYLYDGSHIYYNSSSAQTVSSKTYYFITLSGGGTKSMDVSCTVETQLNVNSPLVINNNQILMLRGGLTATSSITGGRLYIAGTASQLNLPQSTFSQITLNRPSGCLMSGVVTVGQLVLNSGTFSIGNYALRISGDVSYSGGSISGGSNSYLVIEGSGNMFSLPDISLYSLTLDRANGCYMNGTLTTRDLYLKSGTLNIAAGTLQLYGYIYTTSGQLTGSSSSSMTVYGSGDITLPVLTLGTMHASRTGTITMGGNLDTGTLNVSAGSFSIGSYTLTINTRLIRTGTLLGHYGSSLVYNSSSYALSLPAINLNRLTLNSSQGCTLLGNLNSHYLVLSSGILDLSNYTLVVNIGISSSSGTITGTSASNLNLNMTSGSGIGLPQFVVGRLLISGNSAFTCSGNSRVLTELQLNAGSLSPAGSLRLASGTTIKRYGGSLNAAPVFDGTVIVEYNANCAAGPEIPTGTNVLSSLRINSGFTVTSNSDIHLNSSLVLNNNSILSMGTGTLYMPTSCTINSGTGALILGNVQSSISGSGFTLLPGGIGIGSGVEILTFNSSQSTTPHDLQNGPSIGRSWSLSGSFSGTVSVTFTWDSSADNSLGFSGTNRACVMRQVSGNWYQVGDPVDVSGSNPRSITVQTTGFSEWTIGSEESTLPVTLSSFTATLTQLNYVRLDWITQSENNLSGFRLLRAEEDNLINAMDMGILIPATNTSSQQIYSYTDQEVTPPATYYYWLSAMEMDGSVTYSHSVQVILQEQGGPNTPPVNDYPLLSIYPNPFNPVQTLRIAHREDGMLDLRVYNSRGQMLRQIHRAYLSKGFYTLEWDGWDEHGNACASGTYLILCHTPYEDKWIRSCLLK